MNTPNPSNPNDEAFKNGLTIEHILLSVTVVSDRRSCGQFDDSAAYQVTKALHGYTGVRTVNARVLYEHTKIEKHIEGCDCGKCTWKDERDEVQPSPE